MQIPGFENAKYHLLYQPIVCIAPDSTISVVALEAFLRVEQPGVAPLLTDSFLAIAREKGVLETVGYWVIQQACADLADMRDEGYRGRITINVSPTELTMAYVAEVQSALNEYGLAGNLFLMDITLEDSLPDDLQTVEAMEALRRLGIRLYLDGANRDFPLRNSVRDAAITGYKTARLPNTREDHAGIRLQELLDFSRRNGREVIASRVETLIQRDLLLSLNCRVMQGYFFSKPVKAEAVLESIRYLTQEEVPTPQPISLNAILERHQRSAGVSLAA
jgi:diguanylate cyclase